MLLNGNVFADMADLQILKPSFIDYNDIYKAKTIFCKTDFLNQLFHLIENNEHNYNLITGMSDRCIDYQRFIKRPNNISKWYAVNAVYKNDNLIPIPLGIENHKHWVKGKSTDHEWLNDNIDRLFAKPKNTKTLYCNWSTHTNNGRKSVLKLINYPYKMNRVDSRLPYKEYCEEMADYKYVVCPWGNGIDTHRIWEALYMGCIPITINSYVFSTYQLPIMQITSWSEITSDFLQEETKKLKFNYAQLNINYWKAKILNGK